MRLAGAAFFSFLPFLLCSCGAGNDSAEKDPSQTPKAEEQSMTGVVTNVDTDLRQVTIREIGSDVDAILNYDATAVITDRYGSEIPGDDLEQGQIMDATYEIGSYEVIKMNVPEDAWEYDEVSDFSFNSDENSISLAGRKYQYGDDTYFSTPSKKIQMIEIDKNDVLTVRGIGIKAYSVTRTLGHGYLRLLNYDDFVGGLVSVGTGIILPVTENMLITVGEGAYKVTLSKKNLRASRNITISDGEEASLDFSNYAKAPDNVGNISFDIEPKGADLYINDEPIDYSGPLALNYGKYNVRVEMTGYTAYSGILDVENAERTVHIDLIEENASVSADFTPSPSPTKKDDGSEAATKKMDSRHTITVSAPAGAEVYLDNVYKGLAPCTFTKVIGSQTVTLSKPGYVTKSYSVDILDDDNNVKLSFSELVEDS